MHIRSIMELLHTVTATCSCCAMGTGSELASSSAKYRALCGLTDSVHTSPCSMCWAGRSTQGIVHLCQSLACKPISCHCLWAIICFNIMNVLKWFNLKEALCVSFFWWVVERRKLWWWKCHWSHTCCMVLFLYSFMQIIQCVSLGADVS